MGCIFASHANFISAPSPYRINDPSFGTGSIYDSGRTVADPIFRTRVADGRDNLALLSLSGNAILQDSVFTSNLRDLLWVFPGGIQIDQRPGLKAKPILRASGKAGMVDPQRAYGFDADLAAEVRAEEEPIYLAVELEGEFKSAFPDGPPSMEVKQAEPELPFELPGATRRAQQQVIEPADPAQHRSTGWGRVFILGDVDALGNSSGYHARKMQGGDTRVSFKNDNVSVVLNILDRLLGSEHLMDARKTVSVRRPFVVFNEIEREYERRSGEKAAEIDEEIRQAKLAIVRLQSTEGDSSLAFMSAEHEAELARAQAMIVEKQREKRELRRELKRAIDREESRIFMLNLLVVPSALCLFAIILLGV